MLEFHTCDVFTQTPFSGNPLAIVMGADGLSDAQMQTLAREFNLSESIFVMAPVNPNHSARVRIFFPTGEIAFAGHPTIGCAIHLAKQQHQGDFTAHLVLEEQAGLVPVTVTSQDGGIEAEFTAPVLPHAVPGTAPTALIAKALGLPEACIGFGPHRPGIWQGGPRFLYVPVDSLTSLAQARPHAPYWADLMQAAGVDSAYLYTPGPDCDYRARLLAPGMGVPEDPATGSASAILAAQLWAASALRPGETTLTLHQGIEMGRPSRIGLTIVAGADGLISVKVKGSAVAISSGQIRKP